MKTENKPKFHNLPDPSLASKFKFFVHLVAITKNLNFLQIKLKQIRRGRKPATTFFPNSLIQNLIHYYYYLDLLQILRLWNKPAWHCGRAQWQLLSLWEQIQFFFIFYQNLYPKNRLSGLSIFKVLYRWSSLYPTLFRLCKFVHWQLIFWTSFRFKSKSLFYPRVGS